MESINETVKVLEQLQRDYEAALDKGDTHEASLIQRRIDTIEKHL